MNDRSWRLECLIPIILSCGVVGLLWFMTVNKLEELNLYSVKECKSIHDREVINHTVERLAGDENRFLVNLTCER